MQQNNYIEAEDAYRRALVIAPDNNKMCNLGICLMKQGTLGEAKDTLRLVKPAVVDGPRGVDSHLKAYERAQQMLRDLESEMMISSGDRVEQRKLFDAFLGSSALWQPQPCEEHLSLPPSNPSKPQDGLSLQPSNPGKPQDGYADENVNSNIVATKPVMGPVGNSLNIDAKQISIMDQLFHEFKEVKSDFIPDERCIWLDIVGLPLASWAPKAYSKLASRWGTLAVVETRTAKILSSWESLHINFFLGKDP